MRLSSNYHKLSCHDGISLWFGAGAQRARVAVSVSRGRLCLPKFRTDPLTSWSRRDHKCFVRWRASSAAAWARVWTSGVNVLLPWRVAIFAQ